MKTELKLHGFTLVELTVVVSVLSIVMLGLVGLYLSQIQLTDKAVKITDSQAKLTADFNKLLPMIFEASAILSADTINGNSYSSSVSVLVLRLPSVDDSANILTGLSDKVVISKDADNYIDVETEAAAGSKRVTGEKKIFGVNTLSFDYEDNLIPSNSGWVKIEASKDVKTISGIKTVSVSYKAYLKNK